MCKKPFLYLVSLPYVNCNNLKNRQITRLLGIIERSRMDLESKQLYLYKNGKYPSIEYQAVSDQLQDLHIDTNTLINLIKVVAPLIGLSSTPTTQISKN